MSIEQSFSFNGLYNNPLSQGFFTEFYQPNDISSISSDCLSAQNSRIAQFNSALYDTMLSRMILAIERNLKRIVLFQISSFKRASQSQIVAVATGLVKLRYLIEKKLRMVYENGLIKIKDYKKQQKKKINHKKQINKIVEFIDYVNIKYYKLELLREAFGTIKCVKGTKSIENKVVIQGITIVSNLFNENNRAMLIQGIESIKYQNNIKQKAQIFQDTIMYHINVLKSRVLKEALESIKSMPEKQFEQILRDSSISQKTPPLSVQNSQYLITPTLQSKVQTKKANLPPLPTQQINYSQKQLSTQTALKSLESTSKTNVASQSYSTILSPLQVLPSIQKIDLTKSASNKSEKQFKQLLQKQQNVGMTKFSSQNDGITNSRRSLNSNFKASSIHDFECKQVEQSIQESYSHQIVQKQKNHVRPQSAKRQSIELSLNSNNFKKNHFDNSKSQTKLLNPIIPKPEKSKIKQQKITLKNLQKQQSIEFTVATTFIQNNIHKEIQPIKIEKPFESFFFAKNHRSNNLYHRHPDISYQNLGDIIDTPQIFIAPSKSPFSLNYDYQFKKGQNSQLSHVKSADNLLGFGNIQKSIIINDYSIIVPPVALISPITPTNDKYYQQIPDQLKNKDKFNIRATSSGSYKSSRFSSGSEAFKQYLKQKQLSKKGSDYYYSRAQSIFSPSSVQTSNKMEYKPISTGRTQVADYFPMSKMYKQQDIRNNSPRISNNPSLRLTSPLNLNYQNTYK